jgi:hypothetical protein
MFIGKERSMAKKILVLSGSPKKNGNTAALVEWFSEGARSKGAQVEVVRTAFLKYKATGCTSCRACQKSAKYECVINDEAKPVLAKMADVDVIVMATPLYFFAASAFEDVGLDALEKPFALTADYTGMKFESLLVPNAGVSGDIKKKSGVRQKAIALGRKAAAEKSRKVNLK